MAHSTFFGVLSLATQIFGAAHVPAEFCANAAKNRQRDAELDQREHPSHLDVQRRAQLPGRRFCAEGLRHEQSSLHAPDGLEKSEILTVLRSSREEIKWTAPDGCVPVFIGFQVRSMAAKGMSPA